MHCLLELAPGHPLKANHQHFKAQGQKERITVSSKKNQSFAGLNHIVA
jgi:hypothetical protein